MLLRKESVKGYFIFPPHLTSASALRKEKKIASFLLNAECCFASRHRKHIHIITWSQLNCPSFSQETIVCTKQNLGREYSILPSVNNLPHTHRFYQVCCDVNRCIKSGSCSLLSLKWEVNGQYCWDILISQQMLAVIKCLVDDYYLAFSNTSSLTAEYSCWLLKVIWSVELTAPVNKYLL